MMLEKHCTKSRSQKRRRVQNYLECSGISACIGKDTSSAVMNGSDDDVGLGKEWLDVLNKVPWVAMCTLNEICAKMISRCSIACIPGYVEYSSSKYDSNIYPLKLYITSRVPHLIIEVTNVNGFAILRQHVDEMFSMLNSGGGTPFLEPQWSKAVEYGSHWERMMGKDACLLFGKFGNRSVAKALMVIEQKLCGIWPMLGVEDCGKYLHSIP